MSEKGTRVSVKLEDFLRVTVAERDQITSAADAAEALGMTEGSFKARLARERDNYPSIFETVPAYETRKGPKRATLEEAQAILAKLTASNEGGNPDEGGEGEND